MKTPEKRLLPILLASVAMATAASAAPVLPRFAAWTPTPPMGWNSFDCYGATVTESELRANAEAMARDLRPSGYRYVVADIRWYDRMHPDSHGYNLIPAVYSIDKFGRLQPDTGRFPSSANGAGFKPLADYIHGLGLKFGVHLMRGIPRKAVAEKTAIPGTDARADEIYSTNNLCGWLTDMWTVDASKKGAQEYYNGVFRQFADWGLDFVKVDDLSFPYHADEVALIRNAIDACGRPIVFSASPGDTPVENAAHVQAHANMWRVIGDLWDEWPRVNHLFEVYEKWGPWIGNGRYPDADMLPLGRLSIRGEIGEDRHCALTPDEQRTLMTLCAIVRSPLMFGGDLPSLDPATRALLTNPGMLAVHGRSVNNRQLFRADGLVAWAADDPATGDRFLALFNIRGAAGGAAGDSLVSVDFARLGLPADAECQVTDLWTGKSLGPSSKAFTRRLPSHASGLYRVSRR